MKHNFFKSLLLLVVMGMSMSLMASTYCNYYEESFKKENKYVTLTWTTEPNGDVVVYIGEGPGCSSALFRNGGFEGDLNGFSVLSGDGFAVSEPASTYFNRIGESADHLSYRLQKKAELPNPCQIKFTTNAFAWKSDGKDQYCFPTLVYDYNAPACDQLAAPANVAVTDAGVITFDAVDGAAKYEAVISLNGAEMARMAIASGETLQFESYTAGDYQVSVIAKGYDIANSDPSTPAIWALQALELPESEYCYADFSSGNNACQFSWNTLSNGNVEITLFEPDGSVDATKTVFRGGAIKLANLKVGAEPASTYFTMSWSGNMETLALKDPAIKPAIGLKITHTSATVEYKVVKNDNAYPNLAFSYTYGTSCPVNDALLPPTNVAVSADGVLTFEAADGAEAYEARIYRGAEKMMTVAVTSGATLNFTPMFSDTYQVKVISKAEGQPNSEESAAADWAVTAPIFEAPAISEYCEKVYNYNTNNGFSITFATVNGDVVITIGEGNDAYVAGTTVFRNNNGMSGANLAPFTVGPMKEPASVYFDREFTNLTNTFTLKLKDGKSIPAGAKIYYNGTVEYATTGNNNAYGTYQFEYSYGTDCSALTVSAATNDAAKGSAKVEMNGEAASLVSAGDEVTFTAEAKPNMDFLGWFSKGVLVSSDLVFTTTVSETMNLIANFDYHRVAYCREPLTDGGKTVYMTIGETAAAGVYTIRFEGSATAPLASIKSAGYVINWVKTDIDYANPEGTAAQKKKDGQDINFDLAGGRWHFDECGYGAAYITFEAATGKTWEDFHVWTQNIKLNLVGGGEFAPSFFNDANQHHIDWTSKCIDETAPAWVSAVGAPVSTTSVMLKLKATDELEGLVTYIISRTGEEDIVRTAASGEELDVLFEELEANQSYTFSIVAQDCNGNATATAQTVTVSTQGDATAPTNVAISAQPITDHMVKLTVSADEDFAGDITFTVVATPAVVIAPVTSAPGEAKSFFVEGLNAGAEYSFTVTATNAAGLSAENAASATATTFAGNIALGKEAHAGHEDANAGLVTDNNEGNRWSSNGATHPDNDWIYVDLGAVYDVASASIKWENARPAHYVFEVSNDAENWTVAQTYSELMNAEVFVPYLDLSAEGRYFRVRATATAGAYNNLGYGMSIYELRLYGALAVDAEAPTNLAIAANGATKTSVLVAMSADDNFFGELTYEVYCDGEKKGEVSKQSGEEATFVVEGLEIQNYDFYFIVKDAAGNFTQSSTVSAQPFVDEVAPVVGAHSASEITHESVKLTIVATDNSHGIITYEVSLAGELVATTSALSGEEASVVISGLNYLTAYNFSVVAKDASNNAAEAVTIAATTIAPYWPIVAAPAPTHVYPYADVMSIYSDELETVLAHSYNHNQWAGAVTCQEMNIQGNHFYFYTRNTGTETSWGENNEGANALVGKDGYHAETTQGLDVREMQYFHIDIWSATAGTLRVRILDTELGTVTLNGEGWNSFDLPLSAYANQADLSNVRWMKFTNVSGIEYFALDNGYFYTPYEAARATEVKLDNMYTYCPAKNVTKMHGADFYVPEYFDGFYVQLMKVEQLTAGHGYIMIPTEANPTVHFSGNALTSAVDASAATHGMQGCLVGDLDGDGKMPIENSDDNIIIKNNHLYTAYNNYLTAGKAYIRLDIVKTLQKDTQNTAPRRRVGFANNTTTGYEMFEVTEEAQKLMINGQLFIIRGGKMYNVNGELVK